MTTLRDDGAKAERAAVLVRTLAHPDRVRLVASLCQADASVAELAKRLGLPAATLSRHLRALAAQGMVAEFREGGVQLFRIEEPVLHGLVACMEDCSR